MAFNLIDQGSRHQIGTKYEDNQLLVKTVVEDQDVRDSTQRLRSAEAIRTGDKTKLGPDGSEYVYGFQVEPHLWKRFRKEHPDIYAALKGKDAIPRERAAAFIAKTHPEWTLFSPLVKPVPRCAG